MGRYFLILFVHVYGGYSTTVIPVTYFTEEICQRAGEEFMTKTNAMGPNKYVCIEGPGR